ncbi:MAG: hypothetical protein MJ101_05555, partial [Clostridia bacterium]|nr:hypothetical protein [Clostridia bacterium]
NVKILGSEGFMAIRVYENAGGLVGHVKEGATLYIDNCENSLGLYAYRDNVGGFVGLVDAGAYVSIYNSKNTALIQSDFVEDTTYYQLGNTSDGFAIVSESELATCGQYLGGIIGTVYGSVHLSYVENDGEVWGLSYSNTGGEAGGLIGRLDWNGGLDSPSIEHCTNRGKVTGYLSAGGIVGWIGNDSSDQNYDFRYNKNYGAVESKISEAGGIIGHLDTDGCEQYFYGNENYGKVSGYKNAGGIIGYSEAGGEFYSCKNEGAVTSETRNAGGIIGATEDDANTYGTCTNTGAISGYENAGGIVGYAGDNSNDPNFSFTFCPNTGKMYSEKEIAGGIIGYLDSDGSKQYFYNDENYGQIGGANDAGGIIGYSEGGGTITNCKNEGYIGSSYKAGGIIGEDENDTWSISYCSNSAWVLAVYHSGGIAGDLGNDRADPTYSITNCSNSGYIYSLESDAGGIIGLLDTDSDDNLLKYNTNTGSIYACRMAGGICGYTLGDANFYGSTSNADISSFGDDGCHAGGMLGDSENRFNVSELMQYCTVHGNIKSNSGSAHKLYGYSGTTSSVTASVISYGYPEIVFAIGGLAVGFVVAMLIFRKKKSKPVLVEGAANEDEE